MRNNHNGNREVIQLGFFPSIFYHTTMCVVNWMTLSKAVLRRFKIWCFCVAIVTLITVTSTALAVEFAGGSGGPNDPYQIATSEQLISIGSDPNLLDKHFVLVNDIDLDPNLPGGRVFNQAVIAPGTDAASDSQWYSFTGSLDGNGHSIKHLTIHGGIGGYLGLLGAMGGGGQVHNLGLESIVIIGTNGSRFLGGIVGSSGFGTINNCYVTGNVSGGDNCAEIGGLVGFVVQSTITNCYTTASVSAGEDANNLGGLVGYFATGRIFNCYATSSLSGGNSSKGLGGLVGSNGSTISNCYATGSVSGGEDANDLGGLVGTNWGRTINCFFLTPSDGGGPDNRVGVSLTKKRMKQQASFVDWDFDDTWIISEGKDYPRLQPDAPEPPEPSPPDLSLCTRVNIKYYPSTLDIVCRRPAERNLLSPEEIKYLQSLETITTDDEDGIRALAHDVDLGSYMGTGGAISAQPIACFVCYDNSERLTSFTLFGPSISTEEGHWFVYDKGWPSLRILTSQIQPFHLRMDCARNLRILHSNFSKYFLDKKTWPSPTEWCDAIVQNYRPKRSRELHISRCFKCPNVPGGKCHYAVNPRCRPSSPPDTVLLFETKAGWNQHGGPELFSFVNHDPKGGCVLLNDGTVKFIRTKEELQQLRWLN